MGKGKRSKAEAAAAADLRDRSNRVSKAFLTYGGITDDRALAIVSAVLVEECLARLLRSHLSEDCGDLFEVNGPLATHSARYRVAHAMGLIVHSVKGDLEAVARIRNQFAHSIDDDLTFEHPRFTRLFERIVCEKRARDQSLGVFYRRTCETLALPFWLDAKVQAREAILHERYTALTSPTPGTWPDVLSAPLGRSFRMDGETVMRRPPEDWPSGDDRCTGGTAMDGAAFPVPLRFEVD